MAAILIFDPNSSPVPNRVERYLSSQNTTDYLNRNDVLINPVIPDGDLHSMVVDSGAVRLMTALELQTIADAIAAQQAASALASIAAAKAEAKDFTDVSVESFGRVVRALIILIVQQLNVLRAQAGLANITAEQVRNAIKSEIHSQS